MEMQGKKVLVFGTGISGMAACELLLKVNATVFLFEGNKDADRQNIEEKLGENKNCVSLILGTLPEEVMEQLDLLVLSPGVPTDLPIVNEMRERNIPIWGEIELAYRYSKGDVLAITGTNGKTTTTALLGEIIKAYCEETYVVGNIGNPYTAIALNASEKAICVAEMSSFQLETVEQFAPKVSAILNITPDHLNRHHTMEAYIEAKECIAMNQSQSEICVLNYEDEVTRKFGEKIQAEVLYFSSKRKLDRGIYLEDGAIIYHREACVELCKVDELKLLGMHNYENVMAAAAMALAYGVPLETVRTVIKQFAGVEHRIEYVCEKNGVAYYNDSKGTNPDAAIKGIQAMNRPTVLIGGGYDKDSSYEEWIQAFEGKVTYLVLTGQTKEKIEAAAKSCGFTNTILTESFDEAVTRSVELAKSGEAVLLSPACASWGAFDNYEQRGDKFKELINQL